MKLNISKIFDPLRRHFDKILAVVCLVALVMTIVMLAARMTVEREKQKTRINSRERLVSSNRVDTASLSRYMEARDLLRHPDTISVSGDGWALLVPAKRVSCPRCRKPIPYDAEECAYCKHVTGPSSNAVAPTVDTDGDEMPDAWESKYGLNPADADDKNQDPDEDGYSNVEEFTASKMGGTSTDPKNPDDIPPPWMFEKLIVLKTTSLPFRYTFKNITVNADGTTNLFFMDSETSRTPYYPVGTNIGEFLILKFELKFTNTFVPSIGSNIVDVSEVTLQSRDKRKIILRKNQERKDWDRSADLLYRPDRKKIVVNVGSEFAIKKHKYRVKEIDSMSNEVLLFNILSGREVTVKPLGPDAKAHPDN